MCKPYVKCLEEVRHNAESSFLAGFQFVEKISIMAHASHAEEISCHGSALAALVVETLTVQAAHAHTQQDRSECRVRSRLGIERDAQIVREYVGGAEWNHRQCGTASYDPLRHVLDGAVASAGEDCVVTLRDSLLGLLSGLGGRERNNDIGLNSSLAKHRSSSLNNRMGVAALAGMRVVEEHSSAHGSVVGMVSLEPYLA